MQARPHIPHTGFLTLVDLSVLESILRFYCLFLFVCFVFLRHCMGWHLLTSLLTLHTPTTSLRSAERTLPAVLRSRSFTVAAPKLRSKLAFNRTCTLSKPALKSFFIDWLLNQSCKCFYSFSFLLVFCHFVSIFFKELYFCFYFILQVCIDLMNGKPGQLNIKFS